MELVEKREHHKEQMKLTLLSDQDIDRKEHSCFQFNGIEGLLFLFSFFHSQRSRAHNNIECVVR